METRNSRKRGYTMHQVMQLEIKTETEIFKHFIVFYDENRLSGSKIPSVPNSFYVVPHTRCQKTRL